MFQSFFDRLDFEIEHVNKRNIALGEAVGGEPALWHSKAELSHSASDLKEPAKRNARKMSSGFKKLKDRSMKRATLLNTGVSSNTVKDIVKESSKKAPQARYTGFMIARQAKKSELQGTGRKLTVDSFKQSKQQPELDKGWARAIDPRSGLPYVYNLKTRETMWESVYKRQQRLLTKTDAAKSSPGRLSVLNN